MSASSTSRATHPAQITGLTLLARAGVPFAQAKAYVAAVAESDDQVSINQFPLIAAKVRAYQAGQGSRSYH